MPISLVLEHPSHPGNIGASARAMHTMGLDKLILINPCELTEEAYLRARNGKYIIEACEIHEDVAFLDRFHLLYGTTSRQRSLHLPVYNASTAATIINQHIDADIAILFGNETNGLSNQLLNKCSAIIEIPAEPGCSLNLSHALQVICYELRVQKTLPHKQSYATLAERKQFITWLEKTHQHSNTLLPHTLTRVLDIINKAKLSPEELRLLYSLMGNSGS